MWKIVCIALVLAAGVQAEVLDKSANGFLVRSTVAVSANPAQVYDAIVDGVSNWWDSSHTFSGTSKNLTIVAKAGGCFCERTPPDGQVQHMTVIYAAPGRMLRMTGALGPLQAGAVTGTLTFEIKESGKDTQVVLSYAAGGYFQGGLHMLAEPVDRVIAAQLKALKDYLDGQSKA